MDITEKLEHEAEAGLTAGIEEDMANSNVLSQISSDLASIKELRESKGFSLFFMRKVVEERDMKRSEVMENDDLTDLERERERMGYKTLDWVIKLLDNREAFLKDQFDSLDMKDAD